MVIVQNIVKKIKKHLRNLQAENDPKFRKPAGWPKNLVSYKKKNVYRVRVAPGDTLSFLIGERSTRAGERGNA